MRVFSPDRFATIAAVGGNGDFRVLAQRNFPDLGFAIGRFDWPRKWQDCVPRHARAFIQPFSVTIGVYGSTLNHDVHSPYAGEGRKEAECFSTYCIQEWETHKGVII